MTVSPLMSGREASPSFSVIHCAPTCAPGTKSTANLITRRADRLAQHVGQQSGGVLTVPQGFAAQGDLNSRILPRGRRCQQNGSQEAKHAAESRSSSALKAHSWLVSNAILQSIPEPGQRGITFISCSSLLFLRFRPQRSASGHQAPTCCTLAWRAGNGPHCGRDKCRLQCFVCEQPQTLSVQQTLLKNPRLRISESETC